MFRRKGGHVTLPHVPRAECGKTDANKTGRRFDERKLSSLVLDVRIELRRSADLFEQVMAGHADTR